MKEKKDRERFSIKFNANDPAHDAVIRLLEKQGPHSKAQFIVNAVLHYVNCPESPDVAAPRAVDRAAIEEIVAEILGRTGTGKQNGLGAGLKEQSGRNATGERNTSRGIAERKGNRQLESITKGHRLLVVLFLCRKRKLFLVFA